MTPGALAERCQQVSRNPDALEVISATQGPTGRVLLGVIAEFDSNLVASLDFGAMLNNDRGEDYLASSSADPTIDVTLPAASSSLTTPPTPTTPSLITTSIDRCVPPTVPVV